MTSMKTIRAGSWAVLIAGFDEIFRISVARGVEGLRKIQRSRLSFIGGGDLRERERERKLGERARQRGRVESRETSEREKDNSYTRRVRNPRVPTPKTETKNLS